MGKISFNKLSIFLVITALFWLFAHLLGLESLCYFRALFGIPCPGCGMLRAVLFFSQLNFPKAFAFHPLVFLMPFIFLLVLFRKQALLRKIYNNNLIWGSVGVLFVGVWLIRLILFFPHTEPMIFKQSALFVRLVRIMLG